MTTTSRKNNMRTPEQKIKIIQEYLENGGSRHICQKYRISTSTLDRWVKKYVNNESFESQTGRKSTGRPRSKPLSLEEENKRLKIENEFLKKVYDLTNSRK